MSTRRVLVGTLLIGFVVGLSAGFASSSLFGFSAKAGDTNGPFESLVYSTGTG